MKVAIPVILTAALGVTALPSHGHGHQHAHRSVEARNFVMYQKPPPPAPTTTEAPAPAKTTEAPEPEEEKPKPKPAPAPEPEEEESSSSSSEGGEGQGVSTYTDFCGGKKRSIKRATLEEIAYKGNTGTEGNFGCNYMLIKSNLKDEYKYTAKIENIDSVEYECVAYNKIGPKNLIDGFFNGNEALRFKVPAGGVQYLAADENTQGGVVCDAGSIPLTEFGQFASTWAEWDFGNESNGGWSGGDASCLVSAALGLDIPGLKMSGHNEESIIFPGGDGINAFLGGMEALDGLGLNIVPGPAHIDVVYGYKGE